MSNLMEAHRQWASRPADQRFRTLEELRASVHSRRTRSRSVDVDTGRTLVADKDGILQINGTLTPCEPSHWAFGQLATTVGAPAAYLRTLPNDLVVQNLNHGLKHKEAGAVKFMTIESENPDSERNTLQAVTSTTYGRIWDADCVDAVARIVERSGGKFHNPRAYAHTPGTGAIDGFSTIDVSRTEPSGLYASDRDCFMFMIDGGSLLDAGPRAKLNRGFIVYNSEVGAKSFGLITFMFNVVCGNHIIWGAQNVNRLIIRHTSGGPARFDQEATPALLDYVNESAKPIEDTIRRAGAYLLPEKTEDIYSFAIKHAKFSRSEVSRAIDFAKSEEGDCRSLWNLVQGFTAYARGFDYIDTRLDLEKRAGDLLKAVSNN